MEYRGIGPPKLESPEVELGPPLVEPHPEVESLGESHTEYLYTCWPDSLVVQGFFNQ